MEIITIGCHQDFIFNPLSFGALYFTVKAANDAYVILKNLIGLPPVYEIFIGTYANTKSSILLNRSCVVLIDTPNILSGYERKGFWIKWGRGFISVGKQHEEKPFMLWNDKDSLFFTHFGVSTDWGASGVWTIEAPPATTISPDYIQWIHASNGIIPPNAVQGGFDTKNKRLFIARASYNDNRDIIPGKLVPKDNTVYISLDDIVIPKNDYEVLCKCNYDKMSFDTSYLEYSDHQDPLSLEKKENENNNTGQENRNKKNRDLNNSLKKWNDENNDFGSYITKTIKTLKSFDAQKKLKDEIQKVVSQFVHEESMKSYDENLKNFDNSLKYNFISSNDMVVDVSHNESYYKEIKTFSGQDYKLQPLNFGTLHFNIKGANDAYIVLTDSLENKSNEYEIFISDWGKSTICKNKKKSESVIVNTNHIMSDDALNGFWIKWGPSFISVGKQFQETPFMSLQDEESHFFTYYGLRTSWGANTLWTMEDGPPFTEFKWVQASHGKLPPYAIFGGYDSMNKTNLYIARAEHKGCLIPGKYVPMEGCVYISWGDEEIRKEIYEVLCRCNTQVDDIFDDYSSDFEVDVLIDKKPAKENVQN